MPFDRTRRAAAAMNERTKDAAQRDLPAQNIKNQLPGKVLPPASSSTRGGVMLSDDDPLIAGTADPGTSSAASRADHVHPDSGGGGAALTIEEVDGTPSESAPTKLIFPNGTLAVASNEVTYTPAGGGGGVTPNSFYAHKNNVDQNVNNSTFTKVTYGTESWDTGGYWDASTSTFQPTVAGKYEITVAHTWDCNGAFRMYTTLYKNGSRYRETILHSAFAGVFTALATFLIDMNGTTDTIEIYGYQTSGGTRILTGDPLGSWIFGKRVE